MAATAPNYTLDVRPFDKPVNPFSYGAGEVRRQFPDLKGDDLRMVEWYEFLASQAQSTGLTTSSRILVLALLGAASDYETREALEAGLKLIRDNIPG